MDYPQGVKPGTGDGKTCSEKEPERHSLSSDGPVRYRGKTAKEWHDLHEVMRGDFNRILEENNGLRASVQKHEAIRLAH
jgi:hypothetical protein